MKKYLFFIVFITDFNLAFGQDDDVVVTDENGCAVQSSFFIDQPEPLIISILLSDFTGYGIICTSTGNVRLCSDFQKKLFKLRWKNRFSIFSGFTNKE